ncbi:hypothetical protein A3C73_03505 [Candidatus Giovannonibacteria bacterium RIFCSPHIGHO2_02_FULL_44_11]|nr:MAG: hypothetical protein A3C73_03505 [Candidatus Giovannonibacteria bacterium RIFCSPHIGHO2_02_FULL_44_11]
MKRISFSEQDALHIYELSLEHFCTGKNECCIICKTIKRRLEKFAGKKWVRHIRRMVKKNSYCGYKTKKRP